MIIFFLVSLSLLIYSVFSKECILKIIFIPVSLLFTIFLAFGVFGKTVDYTTYVVWIILIASSLCIMTEFKKDGENKIVEKFKNKDSVNIIYGTIKLFVVISAIALIICFILDFQSLKQSDSSKVTWTAMISVFTFFISLLFFLYLDKEGKEGFISEKIKDAYYFVNSHSINSISLSGTIISTALHILITVGIITTFIITVDFKEVFEMFSNGLDKAAESFVSIFLNNTIIGNFINFADFLNATEHGFTYTLIHSVFAITSSALCVFLVTKVLCLIAMFIGLENKFQKVLIVINITLLTFNLSNYLSGKISDFVETLTPVTFTFVSSIHWALILLIFIATSFLISFLIKGDVGLLGYLFFSVILCSVVYMAIYLLCVYVIFKEVSPIVKLFNSLNAYPAVIPPAIFFVVLWMKSMIDSSVDELSEE